MLEFFDVIGENKQINDEQNRNIKLTRKYNQCLGIKNTKCEECYKQKGNIHDLFQIRLCVKCKQLPKYKLICKTDAKNKYYLADDDLIELSVLKVKNPHYSRASDMKLFSEFDVIAKACEKHECILCELNGILKDICKDKNKMAISKQKKKQIKMDKRKYELLEALQKVGLELRNDSNLCSGYIRGSIVDWTIDEIVERMCQMKYLYEYCDFQKYFNKAKQKREKQRELDRMLHMRTYFNESLFDHAERLALKEHNYPPIYPWMK